MEMAAQEEYAVAQKQGKVDKNGTACITVIVDGGWSKRSFGHSYNALSGVVSTLQTKRIDEVRRQQEFILKILLILNVVKFLFWSVVEIEFLY